MRERFGKKGLMPEGASPRIWGATLGVLGNFGEKYPIKEESPVGEG